MKLDSLQYVRGVAALLVVFYHVTVYLARVVGDSSLHDIFGGTPGLLGVLAFFVVSGYLMADIAPKYKPATFLMHRVIRIYPAYWFCVVVAGLFYTALWIASRPNADYVPSIKAMLWNSSDALALLRLTLSPIVFNDYPLGIEWTLLYETTFYVIIFTVSLLGGIKYLLQISLVWLAAVVGAEVLFPARQAGYTQPSLLTVLLFGINSAFIFGIVGRKIQNWIRPYYAFALGSLLICLNVLIPHPYTMLQTCAGVAALVMGFIALELRGRLPKVPSLGHLGNWSYALYLIHVPVILGIMKLVTAPSWFLAIACVVVAVAVSAVLGTLDVAGYGWLKRIADRSDGAHRVIAGLFVLVFLVAGILGLRRG